MSTITIVGSGMMGSALCFPAADNGHEIRLVGTPLDAEIIASVQANRYHPTLKYNLPGKLTAYPFSDFAQALPGSDLLISGVSSFGIDWLASAVLPRLPESLPVLSVTKGLADQPDGTLLPFPQLLRQKLGDRLPALSLNAIGGPCTSYELADRQHTTVAFCGDDPAILAFCQKLLATPYYHIRCTTDVIGLEFAVALKNAYALGVALAIGLQERKNGIGAAERYNPQAALFGQSLREMARIIARAGGTPASLTYGASDLYVTIFGGRTRTIGTLLGRGLGYTEARAKLSGITLESVAVITAAARALRRSTKAEQDYPLLLHLDQIINHAAPVAIPWDNFG